MPSAFVEEVVASVAIWGQSAWPEDYFNSLMRAPRICTGSFLALRC